jgi:hypothetical protein
MGQGRCISGWSMNVAYSLAPGNLSAQSVQEHLYPHLHDLVCPSECRTVTTIQLTLKPKSRNDAYGCNDIQSYDVLQSTTRSGKYTHSSTFIVLVYDVSR